MFLLYTVKHGYVKLHVTMFVTSVNIYAAKCSFGTEKLEILCRYRRKFVITVIVITEFLKLFVEP
jgi:hypothetical protein